MSKRKASFDSDNASQNSAAVATARRKANSFDVSLNSESTVTQNDVEERKSSFDLPGNLIDEENPLNNISGVAEGNDDVVPASVIATMSSRSRNNSMVDDQLLFDALGSITGNRSRSNTMDTLGVLGLQFRSRSNTLDTIGTSSVMGNARSRSNSFVNTIRSRSNSLAGLVSTNQGESGMTSGNPTYTRHRSNSLDDLVIAASALQHTGLIDDVTAAASMFSSTSSYERHRSNSLNSTTGSRPRSTSSPLLSATASLADDMSTNSFLLNNEMQKMVQTAVAACADIDNFSTNAENVVSSQNNSAFQVDSSTLENTVAALAASTSNIHEINYDEIASMAVPVIDAKTNHSNNLVPSEIRVPRSETPVRNNFSIQPKVPSSAKRHTPKDLWKAREQRSAAESETAIPLPTSDQSSYPIVSISATLPRPKSKLPRSMSTNENSGNEKGQSNQKWDEMFECLKQFVVDKKDEEKAKGTNMEEWIWDGNVPTNFKTKDGKALGRWINNQRSAKNKGSLKKDREDRLIGTGLKWSVLSTNAWPDMMNELRIYVSEKTKNGQSWDGNVPTNYKIKSAPDGTVYDEEKNLGRWINRQRSLFQANRLRKDRQMELEQLGLKWSVLSTTSWDSMFITLKNHVDEIRRTNPEKGWDGNVPANFKTKCQKSLGRWVNRQRAAYAKEKLKKEYVDKLEALGLKWSELKGKDDRDDDDGSTCDEALLKAKIQASTYAPFLEKGLMMNNTILPTLPKLSLSEIPTASKIIASANASMLPSILATGVVQNLNNISGDKNSKIALPHPGAASNISTVAVSKPSFSKDSCKAGEIKALHDGTSTFNHKAGAIANDSKANATVINSKPSSDVSNDSYSQPKNPLSAIKAQALHNGVSSTGHDSNNDITVADSKSSSNVSNNSSASPKDSSDVEILPVDAEEGPSEAAAIVDSSTIKDQNKIEERPA